jgi:hypothetical protein
MTKPKRKSDILKQRARPKKRRFLRAFMLWCLLLGFIFAVLGALAGVGVYFYF